MLCCVSMLVGVFAFFTDRTTENATATAGNIDLVFTDTSAASESTGDSVQARDSVWDNGSLLVDGGILNPGDTIDMDYKLANTGSKSIDVLSQLVLTSSVALTDDAEEYTLTIAGVSITPTTSNEGKTLTYAIPEFVLNGSVETEDGVSITEREFEVAMAFDRLAKNKFMDSEVSITLDVQAKQHRNTTDADWVDFAKYTSETDGFEIIEAVGYATLNYTKVLEANSYDAMGEVCIFDSQSEYTEYYSNIENDSDTFDFGVGESKDVSVNGDGSVMYYYVSWSEESTSSDFVNFVFVGNGSGKINVTQVFFDDVNEMIVTGADLLNIID